MLPTWLEPYQIGIDLVETTTPFAELTGELVVDTQGLSYVMADHSLFRLEPFQALKASGVRKAMGKNIKGLSILDACAGFGDDTLGLRRDCALTMVEQNLRTALFLAERLYMLEPAEEATPVLVTDNVVNVLEQASFGQWDIIYLDPMFPERKKQALPKRGMQTLSQLQAGQETTDVELLLEQSKQIAGLRTVLKRRSKDPRLGTPNHQVMGAKVRFDIYLS
jgi:16S rRNA (guanine1516-N2)-methyltransferase